MHHSALPCHMSNTDDRRSRRCREPRRNGTGGHPVQLYTSGCWCRREDSNLHGVAHPTRSLAWRVSLFRSEPTQPHDTPVTWVHLHATGPEYSFWSRVPSGCPARKASEPGRPVFEALTRQVLNLVSHSPGPPYWSNSAPVKTDDDYSTYTDSSQSQVSREVSLRYRT